MYTVHYGKKSWWDGTVTTLCGLKFSSKDSEYTFMGSVTCPACKQAKRR